MELVSEADRIFVNVDISVLTVADPGFANGRGRKVERHRR